MNQSNNTEIIDIFQMERYFFADLAAGNASSGKRNRRARQAIVGVGRDYLNRFFELYSWAGFDTPSDFRDRIIDVAEQFKPDKFGLEANGMQVLFGEMVRHEARHVRKINARFLPIYQPTKVKKDYRIRSGLDPVINDGRLFLQSKTSELAIEIRSFPTGATVDMIDALETAIRLAPKATSSRRKSYETEEYARYLRNSGCPAHLIKAKVDAFANGRKNQDA